MGHGYSLKATGPVSVRSGDKLKKYIKTQKASDRVGRSKNYITPLKYSKKERLFIF